MKLSSVLPSEAQNARTEIANFYKVNKVLKEIVWARKLKKEVKKE
jgi:hypothetical protein